MRQKKTVEYCDNPDCDSPPVIVEKGYINTGYRFGAGSYDNGAGGGPLPAIYVCSLPCLVPAVNHAIKELWR